MSASMHDLFDCGDMSLLSDHTPEPWYPRSAAIASKFHHIGSDARERVAVCNTAADARRIVACVNACAGISTTGLEVAGLGGLHHIAEATFEQRMDRNQIEQQRDKLIDVLKEVVNSLTDDDYKMASAIIAEVEAAQ